MTRVLLTAFEPYDRWKSNASWLALMELTCELPKEPAVTTRLYPVDFAAVRQRLAVDLAAHYDVALHLGQAPGSGCIRLETIGLNLQGEPGQAPEQYRPLVEDGPVAYRTRLPVPRWLGKLRAAGIPAQVSYHAGTYLCNGLLYLTHHLAQQQVLKTQAAFVHLPLDAAQAAEEPRETPSLPASISATAIRLILEDMAEHAVSEGTI